MNELINCPLKQHKLRWQLLSGVSAAALTVASLSSALSAEDDVDRPTVWIELGGQLERAGRLQDTFEPSFTQNFPSTFFSPLAVQRPPNYTHGFEGTISFEPHGTDWVISASLRYGRANGVRHETQLINNKFVPVHFTVPQFGGKYIGGYSIYPSGHAKFEDFKTQQGQTHAILDFQVGKDVGVGLFGNSGASVLSAGIRIAQFTSKSDIALRAEPDVQYPSAPINSFAEKYALSHATVRFHDYKGVLQSQRSFAGIGPKLDWQGSLPLVGQPGDEELSFDWGANAAVLIGRQKVSGQHETTTRIYSGHSMTGPAITAPATAHRPIEKPRNWMGLRLAEGTAYPGMVHQSVNTRNLNRTRSVIVPNVGGFAGISFLYSHAKVSFGYRADFFFGALDGGIDTRKSETLGFYGPFATISVGLGG